MVAEPEADPQYLQAPLSSYFHSAYNTAPVAVSSYRPVAAPITTYSTVAAPVSTYQTVAAPVSTYSAYQKIVSPVATYSASPVSTYANNLVASPFYGYSGVSAPVAYSGAAGTQTTLTSYNNPEQYTAINTGVYGTKYIAKNGAVEHVVKREADSDANLYYSAPTSTYSAIPSTYSAIPATYASVKYSAIPSTYSSIPSAYSAIPSIYSAIPSTYSASAIPSTYSAIPSAYSAIPTTYSAIPSAYSGAVAYKPDHAIASTPYGYTHSANVGICTNVNGVQVAC